jgi:energy-converting hydrogenase Eha subunit C
MVGPSEHASDVTIRTTAEEKEKILRELTKWRLIHWREYWQEHWPNYRPKSLVSDADLENIAKHAGSINTIDDLHPLMHIIHWSALSKPLFGAVCAALALAMGIDLMEPVATIGVQQQPAGDQVITIASPSAGMAQQQKHGKLQPFENVMQF